MVFTQASAPENLYFTINNKKAPIPNEADTKLGVRAFYLVFFGFCLFRLVTSVFVKVLDSIGYTDLQLYYLGCILGIKHI